MRGDLGVKIAVVIRVHRIVHSAHVAHPVAPACTWFGFGAQGRGFGGLGCDNADCCTSSDARLCTPAAHVTPTSGTHMLHAQVARGHTRAFVQTTMQHKLPAPHTCYDPPACIPAPACPCLRASQQRRGTRISLAPSPPSAHMGANLAAPPDCAVRMSEDTFGQAAKGHKNGSGMVQGAGLVSGVYAG